MLRGLLTGVWKTMYTSTGLKLQAHSPPVSPVPASLPHTKRPHPLETLSRPKSGKKSINGSKRTSSKPWCRYKLIWEIGMFWYMRILCLKLVRTLFNWPKRVIMMAVFFIGWLRIFVFREVIRLTQVQGGSRYLARLLKMSSHLSLDTNLGC